MADRDRSIHPDIHEINDVDVLIGQIVASCGCLTKTPEPQYHSTGCRYRHLVLRLEEVRPTSVRP